jgi:hypothetical protein
MTITLTREEAQQVLDCIVLSTEYKLGNPAYEQMEAFLCARLSAPEPKTDVELINRGCRYTTELTQPEPEPVAWGEVMQHYCYLLDNLGDLPIPDFRNWSHKQWEKGSALLDANDYFRTAPPQREWQGLTDEEIEDACWTEVDQRMRSFARAIEAKLKEKNT